MHSLKCRLFSGEPECLKECGEVSEWLKEYRFAACKHTLNGKCVYGNVSGFDKQPEAAQDARSTSARRRGEHGVRIHPDRNLGRW